MYQVTVKGRTLEELKHAVNDINNELCSGATVPSGIEKTFIDVAVPLVKEASRAMSMELAEDEEEIQSPYTEAPPLAEVPAVIASPVAVDGELDVEGIPWDKRIHASSKGKVAKGTWRTKRGLDVAVLAQVKAELLQAIHIKANPIAIPAAPIDATTPAVAIPVLAPVAPVAVAPVAPVAVAPVAVAPALPVIQGGHTAESFAANMAMVIGTLITEGKLTQDYVNQLKTHFGVTEIWNVSEEQKLEMFNTFVAHSIIVKVG